jgi:FkbM family methyltransferase
MSPHGKWFERDDLPVLTRWLEAAALSFVDIGGRGRAFDGVVPLARFARYYVSEPDQREADRLREELPRQAPWQGVTIINEAIASRPGPADLYLTSSPGMSSLLEPDADVAARFYLAGKFAVESVVSVPTVTLDAAAERYGFADASFIKLDTQGTELDILQSGERLVAGSLLGVFTESNFQPFYRGQSLFADVDTFLRQHGFTLFSLNRTQLRRAGFRPDVYSTRVVTWAHCLYLREPETLMTIAGGEALARQLTRLLGLALAFAYHDLAFEIVAMGRRLAVLAEAEADQAMDEIARVAANTTAYVLRRTAKRAPQDVLASSARDPRQFD